MKKQFFLLMILVVSVSFVATGCGKTVEEKAAEKSIENALGGDVDADVSDGSVKLETDQGTWQAGEDSQLPDSWSDDVYVPDGKIIGSSDTEVGGKSVTVEAEDSIADLKTKYQSELTDNGWNITMSLDMGAGVMIGAEKDERALSINISDEDGQVTVLVIENVKQF